MLDDYLMGKLSPEQVSDFERLLQSDPILANEANLQNDIISGISSARRAALKARLNNIEIPKLAWYTNPKVIGFAAVTFIIGLLIALFFPTDNTKSNVETNSAVVAVEPAKEISTPAASTESIITQNEKAPKEVVASSSKPNGKPVLSNPEKSKSVAHSNLNEPNIEGSIDNEDGLNKKSDATEIVNNTTVAGSTKTLNTETFSDNPNYTYHYKRNDSRLTLYGNFSDKTYQIIEINGKTGTSFYMYHNGSYFGLPASGGEIKELTALSDEAIINKLANLRKRK